MADRALYDELIVAIGAFLAEFAVLESMYLSLAINAVSYDSVLVDFLPETMDLSGRLKLLKYVAEARDVPDELLKDIATVCNRVGKLSERRNDIAHGTATISGPFLKGVSIGDWVAGVRRPRSKWTWPTTRVTEAEKLTELTRSWLHKVPEINQWARETILLQVATNQLAEKLNCHRRNEPWEHLKIEIPDQVGGKSS